MKYQMFSIFLCVAALFGPVVTEGGLIDPRFPDYIVEPFVDCPTEGFFAHPRNCSWFYRCHVSENITDLGYFRRDYFECAPGTAFSSELSICNFESYENCNPDFCDTCGLVKVDYCDTFEVCPDPSNKSNKISLVLCENPIYDCANCTDKSPCQGGDWLISLLKRRQSHTLQRQSSLHVCFPSPYSPEVQCRVCTDCSISTQPPAPCTDCSISTSNCRLFDVCPDGENHVNMTLCSLAANVCQPCQSTQNICQEGQFYSMEQEKCYGNPDAMACPKCDDCYISTSRCQAVDVCPDGKSKVLLTLCPTAKRVCDPCGNEENVCSSGQYYSMETAACYPPPTDSSMRCSPQSNIKRDSSAPSKVDSRKKGYPALECSARNIFPQDLWIKEKFCKNYQPCSVGSGLPSGVIELCTSYYECVYRVTDHEWNAVKNKCTKNMLFSFEAEACIPEPKNICRVF